MTTLEANVRARLAPAVRRPAVLMPTWIAVVASRLLVLAAGIAGAILTKRVPSWTQFDPTRITSHLGAVGDVLAAPAVRWDSIHYLQIAEHGYTYAANTPFYPLYPLLIHILAWVVQSQVLAGVIISCTSYAVALTLLYRLTRDELGDSTARTTVLLLTFAPLSFFFSAVYTESLFLAFLVGSFYLARRNRFAWAGLAAAAATLTHVEGILLTAPLVLMYWRSRGRSFSLRGLSSWGGAALALPALSLAGFCVYLHAQGYGWLAPVSNANTSGYGRSMVGTPKMVWQAITAALAGLVQTLQGYKPMAPNVDGPFSTGFTNMVYLVVLVIAVAAFVAAWRRLPREYTLFAALSLVVATSSAVGGRPLESFDRYALSIFPLWMGAAAWLEHRKLLRPVLMISSTCLVFYVIEFTRWTFIA